MIDFILVCVPARSFMAGKAKVEVRYRYYRYNTQTWLAVASSKLPQFFCQWVGVHVNFLLRSNSVFSS